MKQKMPDKIKTICAWCEKLISDGETPMLLGKPRVSHGICKQCIKQIDKIDTETLNLD